MSRHQRENQPISPERRHFLQMGVALGATGLFYALAAEHTSDTIAAIPGAVQTPTESPRPTKDTGAEMVPAPPRIEAAEPRRLVIPVLKFDQAMSGAIHPVAVARRGTDVYYDPPTNDGIYRAEGAALPASPSEGTTYLFGHSDVDHVVGGAVFDRLPNLVQRDHIELTTTLGRFAYEVTKNLTIPYDELSRHTAAGDFGDGSTPDRLVLITCHVPDANVNVTGYNTVITANQIDATPL